MTTMSSSADEDWRDEVWRDWFAGADHGKSDRTYRLIWSWAVPNPFEYSRRLNRAWTRNKLPVRRLLVSAGVTGRIAVTLEVGAANTTTVLAEWGDFPLRAV